MEVIERETRFEKAIGVGPRLSIPKETIYRFSFGEVAERPVHMLWVGCDLRVLWLQEATVTDVRVLDRFRGAHTEKGDEVLEMHAETLNHIDVGDTVSLSGTGSLITSE